MGEKIGMIIGFILLFLIIVQWFANSKILGRILVCTWIGIGILALLAANWFVLIAWVIISIIALSTLR